MERKTKSKAQEGYLKLKNYPKSCISVIVIVVLGISKVKSRRSQIFPWTKQGPLLIMFILASLLNVPSTPCHLTKIQTKLADLVQIVPEDFDKDPRQAIEDNINAKYANKVIQKIGLCICLYDLLFASEGLIGHGTGLINVNGMSGKPGWSAYVDRIPSGISPCCLSPFQA